MEVQHGVPWRALLAFLLLPALLMLRIQVEERMLRKDLPGYVDSCEKVRFLLGPRSLVSGVPVPSIVSSHS